MGSRVAGKPVKIVLLIAVLVLGGVLSVQPSFARQNAGAAADSEQWLTLKKGLKYRDVVVGEGAEVQRGHTVQVHYTGWLEDGRQFDSSKNRGAAFVFKVGAGMVIAGAILVVRN